MPAAHWLFVPTADVSDSFLNFGSCAHGPTPQYMKHGTATPQEEAKVVVGSLREWPTIILLPALLGHQVMVPQLMQLNMHCAHGSTMVGCASLPCHSLRVAIVMKSV